MKLKTFHTAFRASLPVLMGYLTMGMAAGILLSGTVRNAWISLWAFFSSALIISGALQFIAVDWIVNMTSLLQVLFLTFCLNIRYAMYGMSLLEKFKGIPWYQKAYLIWAMTDETYAIEVAHRPEQGEDPLSFCLTVAALNHLYWILGVTAGALLGAGLPFSTRGIDFAMTALFLVVLTDQCRTKENRFPALLGIVSALLGRLFAPVSHMLIPAIGILLALLVLLRKKWEDQEKK